MVEDQEIVVSERQEVEVVSEHSVDQEEVVSKHSLLEAEDQEELVSEHSHHSALEVA